MRTVAERDDIGVDMSAIIACALRACAARVGRHERAIEVSSVDVPRPFSTRNAVRVVCERGDVGVASSAHDERSSASAPSSHLQRNRAGFAVLQALQKDLPQPRGSASCSN